MDTTNPVDRTDPVELPTAYGCFTAAAFRAPPDGTEHLALLSGPVTSDGRLAGDGHEVLVRIHSECLTGDALGSLRCDCGPQLHAAMRQLAREGGVLIYLRGHEGRGVGLQAKLGAYAQQDHGADTVDANLRLGLPVDARDYTAAAALLTALGVRSVRLITHNPDKAAALRAGGIRITAQVLHPAHVNPANARYLRTKRDRLHHCLPDLRPPPPTA